MKLRVQGDFEREFGPSHLIFHLIFHRIFRLIFRLSSSLSSSHLISLTLFLCLSLSISLSLCGRCAVCVDVVSVVRCVVWCCWWRSQCVFGVRCVRCVWCDAEHSPCVHSKRPPYAQATRPHFLFMWGVLPLHTVTF